MDPLCRGALIKHASESPSSNFELTSFFSTVRMSPYPRKDVERVHECSDTRPRRWGVCGWVGSGEVETFVMVFYTASNTLNNSSVGVMGLSCSCSCDGYIEQLSVPSALSSHAIRHRHRMRLLSKGLNTCFSHHHLPHSFPL